MNPELFADPIHGLVVLAHIVAGFLGMVGGLIPLFNRKGGRGHRTWGRVALYAMGVAALTAFPLAAWRQDVLQAAIGILAGYACLVTVRALRRARRDPWNRKLDLGMALMAGAVGLATLLHGTGLGATEARTAAIFGALLLILAVREANGLREQGQLPSSRVVDHALAATCVLCVGWGSFLNTQLYRLTGIALPLDVRLALPLLVAIPLLAVLVPRWSRGVARQGLGFFRGPDEDSEVVRLRRLAIAEGISFVFLLLIAVPVKRILGEPGLVQIAGPVHGTLTLLYFASVLMAKQSLRWTARDVAIALAAGVVPFATFLIHRKIVIPPDPALRIPNTERREAVEA